ncbi:hypothetical protein TNCV_2965011 [Trichonephila clavipes]|nr:hypothetical protein TNCV_2965011 [Trichonephila clavipes]
MFWSTAFALPAYAGNYNTFAGSLNLLVITETREEFEKGGKESSKTFSSAGISWCGIEYLSLISLSIFSGREYVLGIFVSKNQCCTLYMSQENDEIPKGDDQFTDDVQITSL